MMALLEKDGSIRAAKLDACSRAVDACKAQLSQLQKLSQSVTAAKNDDAINALLPGVEAALSHGRCAQCSSHLLFPVLLRIRASLQVCKIDTATTFAVRKAT